MPTSVGTNPKPGRLYLRMRLVQAMAEPPSTRRAARTAWPYANSCDALTTPHQIKPTSTKRHSAWRPNRGRRSTHQRGDSVQTTETGSTLTLLPLPLLSPSGCAWMPALGRHGGGCLWLRLEFRVPGLRGIFTEKLREVGLLTSVAIIPSKDGWTAVTGKRGAGKSDLRAAQVERIQRKLRKTYALAKD
jgi:hypothetical protein